MPESIPIETVCNACRLTSMPTTFAYLVAEAMRQTARSLERLEEPVVDRMKAWTKIKIVLI